MTAIISYAQNFEDVMLWRALGHIQNGYYIDIGAQDPIVDSVSLAFHQHGWKGTHVEPTPHYAEMLRQQRPGDEVIQAAISIEPGVIRFFEIPETGISTGDPTIAQQHRDRGFDVREISVVSITLASIFDSCKEAEFHWLKIDVEGFEEQVLISWAPSAMRPWIVVVESTLPLTQIDTHEKWEPILVGYGYDAVYFDGLNRYYVSNAHPELRTAFSSPPNVFDGFSLNGTANNPIHHLIAERYKHQISKLGAERDSQILANKSEIDRLNQNFSKLIQEHELQKQSIELNQLGLESQLRALQQRSEAEKLALILEHQNNLRNVESLHVEHDRFNTERISDLNQELHDLLADYTAHAKIRAERSETQKLELVSLLQSQAQRDHEALEQMLAIKRQAELDKAEHAQMLQREYAENEKNHAERLDIQRQEFVNILQSQTQLQHDTYEQMRALQLQAELDKAEQVQALQYEQSERLNSIKQQLQNSEQDNCRLEDERKKREKELLEQITVARFELQDSLRVQVHREQEIAKQLQGIREQTQMEFAKYVLSRDEETRFLQIEGAQREKELFAQNNIARLELENCLRAQIRRELEISTLLDVAKQKSEKIKDELEQMKRTYSWRFTAPLRWIRSSFSRHVESECKDFIHQNFDQVGKDYYVAMASESIQLYDENKGNFKMPKSSKTAFKPNLDGIYHVSNFYPFYDSEFVSAAYTAILKRPPDSEGGEYYLARIRSGISRENILIQMLKSVEAKAIGIRIQGLKAYQILDHILNIPFIGTVAALLMFSLTIKNHMRNLRALENYVYQINISVASHLQGKSETKK